MTRTRLAVLLLAVALFAPSLRAADAPAKPNVVFVLSDDLAQGDVGCYGQKLIKTPHLDAMAKEGTRFTQAYCGTSVCAPSRASLMIGKHMGHSPIRANREVHAALLAGVASAVDAALTPPGPPTYVGGR